MIPFSIFIGYDAKEHEAFEVAQWSIYRRASEPVLITPLRLDHLGFLLTRPVERATNGQLWCPISQAPMATEFAISRFCVPFIQKTGWALFADCDILCNDDIVSLFTLRDPRYAVMVVKHQHRPIEAIKMDDQIQTIYPRKNWSSVVLWNCDHPSNKRLTLEVLNSWPGRDLHAFRWLEDSEIGELPSEWNHLVSVDPPMFAKILHFTLGGPWLPNIGAEKTVAGQLWLREQNLMRSLNADVVIFS